jgi:TonB family protein
LLALVHVSALAQAPTAPTPPEAAAPMTDADRAKRDANKVFQFIKLHAVRANPAPAAAAAQAPRPVAPAKPAIAAANKPATTAVTAAAATSAVKAAAATANEPAPMVAQTGADKSAGAELQLPSAAAAAAANAVPTPVAPTVAPTVAPAAAETEEIELAIIKHVQPELPSNRMGNLRSGSVWVQFTVEPDGSTKGVQARPGAQVRLAQSAVRAVEQWRFAPIPSARDVSIEFVFKIE